MFNLETKKIIIGSTSNTIYQRAQSHLKGKVDSISKRAAHYILQRGTEKWIIMPIEYIQDKDQQFYQEGHWARQFKTYLVNNP